MGNYKLLIGTQQLSYWQGPDFPNASSAPYGVLIDPKLKQLCSPCLFDVYVHASVERWPRRFPGRPP